jgi:hypothetical protein
MGSLSAKQSADATFKGAPMFAFMTGLAYLVASNSFAGEPAPSPAPEVELALGYQVKNRQIVAVDAENVFVDGESVVAWTQVANFGWGIMQHVWYHDGVEVARHDLPVGSAHRWRSWSRQRVSEGVWEVKVLAPDGRVLRQESFTVAWEPGC